MQPRDRAPAPVAQPGAANTIHREEHGLVADEIQAVIPADSQGPTLSGWQAPLTCVQRGAQTGQRRAP
jgi:hypothetical protein